MTAGGDWRQTFRPDIPGPARMYNYFLGGKDHYEADRKAAAQVIAAIPKVWAPLWRPEPGTAPVGDPSDSNVYTVVARKP